MCAQQLRTSRASGRHEIAKACPLATRHLLRLRRAPLGAHTQSCTRALAPAQSCSCQALSSERLETQGSAARQSGAVPDFELIKIPGDGSCMFQALAQGHHLLTHGQVLSSRQLHSAGYSVRRDICFMLQEHRSEVEPFIPGDYDAYVSHMAREGVWGGEPELAMASRSLQRPVLVYSMTKTGLFGSELTKTAEYGADTHTNVPPVCLLFHNYHYDVLRAKA